MSEIMKAYRVDKRPFRPGDTVRTAGEFSDKHPDKGKRAEEILEAGRPEGKPVRRGCLMVFEEEACARRHWAKMSGSKLYEVEIDSAAILHRGDMRHVDALGEALDDEAESTRLAGQYWEGQLTAAPIVEVLLLEAQVSAVISDSEAERKEEFKKIYQIRGIDPNDPDEDWDEFIKGFAEPKAK